LKYLLGQKKSLMNGLLSPQLPVYPANAKEHPIPTGNMSVDMGFINSECFGSSFRHVEIFPLRKYLFTRNLYVVI
jgi:hypothetical protein